jgi:F-type H+-transporting ATPase subunit epsilon
LSFDTVLSEFNAQTKSGHPLVRLPLIRDLIRKIMFLEIVTPDKNIFSGDIVSVSFPGSNGEFGIQENHAPIVATLKEGKIKVDANGTEHLFEVSGGVVEVNQNKIIVLAD